MRHLARAQGALPRALGAGRCPSSPTFPHPTPAVGRCGTAYRQTEGRRSLSAYDHGHRHVKIAGPSPMVKWYCPPSNPSLAVGCHDPFQVPPHTAPPRSHPSGRPLALPASGRFAGYLPRLAPDSSSASSTRTHLAPSRGPSSATSLWRGGCLGPRQPPAWLRRSGGGPTHTTAR